MSEHERKSSRPRAGSEATAASPAAEASPTPRPRRKVRDRDDPAYNRPGGEAPPGARAPLAPRAPEGAPPPRESMPSAESTQPRGQREARGAEGGEDWRRQDKRRGHGRRGGRRRRGPREEAGADGAVGEGLFPPAEGQGGEGDPSQPAGGHGAGGQRGAMGESEPGSAERSGFHRSGEGRSAEEGGLRRGDERGSRRHRRRRRGRGFEDRDGDERRSEGSERQPGSEGGPRAPAGGFGAGLADQGPEDGESDFPEGDGEPEAAGEDQGPPGANGRGARGRALGLAEGLLVTDKGGHGKLRRIERMWLPDMKNDVHVSPRLIQKYSLRDGSIVRGPYGPGYGKHRYDLMDVQDVDGRDPQEVRGLTPFKALTSIDPDFQYELGDFTKDVSLRVIDVICPIGRGQRGLIVAPPRSGKTILMQKIARGISEHYPDVKLIVLLVDERPEEATEWQRSTRGQVFVSTNDESPKNHVELAESVWARCRRLVELGEDVIVLLDSITRLARAYNNVHGNSGKTMSGGIDSKTMERPKQFFGSARNTETAGSLTILGTTLVETGSKMDQVIFEEFKGTGNMELVLSRKLAERRIFPAIDVERSGTRKEEKLLSSTRLRRVNTLRRVLMRMHFADAMDLLTTKLEAVERNDDFLKRFDVDPEL